MIKEKLKKFGEYALISLPAWSPFLLIGLNAYFNPAEKIDDCFIRRDNYSTQIFTGGNSIISATELRDNNNDGYLDEKRIWISAPRRPLIKIEKELTSEDQKLYEGLLAKL